jgi:hypothetical protein
LTCYLSSSCHNNNHRLAPPRLRSTYSSNVFRNRNKASQTLIHWSGLSAAGNTTTLDSSHHNSLPPPPLPPPRTPLSSLRPARQHDTCALRSAPPPLPIFLPSSGVSRQFSERPCDRRAAHTSVSIITTTTSGRCLHYCSEASLDYWLQEVTSPPPAKYCLYVVPPSPADFSQAHEHASFVHAAAGLLPSALVRPSQHVRPSSQRSGPATCDLRSTPTPLLAAPDLLTSTSVDTSFIASRRPETPRGPHPCTCDAGKPISITYFRIAR